MPRCLAGCHGTKRGPAFPMWPQSRCVGNRTDNSAAFSLLSDGLSPAVHCDCHRLRANHTTPNPDQPSGNRQFAGFPPGSRPPAASNGRFRHVLVVRRRSFEGGNSEMQTGIRRIGSLSWPATEPARRFRRSRDPRDRARPGRPPASHREPRRTGHCDDRL